MFDYEAFTRELAELCLKHGVTVSSTAVVLDEPTVQKVFALVTVRRGSLPVLYASHQAQVMAVDMGIRTYLENAMANAPEPTPTTPTSPTTPFPEIVPPKSKLN